MSGRYDEEEDDFAPPESFWQRLNRLLWVLLILTVVIVIISAFFPELQKQRTERAELDRLHRLVEEQKSLHSKYTREVSWLQNDPEYLGIVARDRLNLMKEGESILVTEPPKTPTIEPEVPTAPRMKPENNDAKPAAPGRKFKG